MGSTAKVNPEYAKVLLSYLGFEITDELKKKVGSKDLKLSILLDDKILSDDQKAEFSNTSPYVIANDVTKSYHLCLSYFEQVEKSKRIENVERAKSLAEIAKITGEIKERKLDKLDKEIEQKEKAKKFAQDEYDKLEVEKRFLERDMPDLKAAAESFSERRNEAEKEYKKLVGKIERLRKNFLIRVLFRICKLELE